MTATLTRPQAAHASSKHGSSSFLDDELLAELAQLAAINEELLAGHEVEPAPALAALEFSSVAEETEDELTCLRQENSDLRARVADLESQLATDQAAKEEGAAKLRELETLLEEKTEVIRVLHLKIEELKAGKGSQSGEIEHAFREMEEDRQRFKKDEEALQNQARDMETALARERAELSRQRADLQRLQADLNREIENSARDPQLRERLQSLQRRPGSRPDLPSQVIEQSTVKTPEPTPTKKTGSGLFRRLFGGTST